MKLHYLEIVASDVGEVCAGYEAALGAKFSPPDPLLGGARTARLSDGTTVGVRGPLRETEKPVVRPYWLVEDVQAAVEAAAKQGASIAISSMPIPGKGTIAIYIHEGVEHGLWQL
jgi:predicted enzyme related to lactoylglutathione lyase